MFRNAATQLSERLIAGDECLVAMELERTPLWEGLVPELAMGRGGMTKNKQLPHQKQQLRGAMPPL